MISGIKSIKNVGKYVLIQELCGFDCIDECYDRNSGKKGMPVYVTTYDSLKNIGTDCVILVLTKRRCVMK